MTTIKLPTLDDDFTLERTFQAIALDVLKQIDGVRAYDTSILARPPGMDMGAPDIIVCVDGLFVALELKGKQAKLSQHQGNEQKRVEAAGGHYAVCRTLGEVLAAVRGARAAT